MYKTAMINHIFLSAIPSFCYFVFQTCLWAEAVFFLVISLSQSSKIRSRFNSLSVFLNVSYRYISPKLVLFLSGSAVYSLVQMTTPKQEKTLRTPYLFCYTCETLQVMKIEYNASRITKWLTNQGNNCIQDKLDRLIDVNGYKSSF